jgi:hypothetical protein
MRSSSIRLVLAMVVFVAAVGGGLLFLRGSDEGSSSGGSGSNAGSSEIWQVGDEWTVQVKQDAGAISPDGDANVAKIPFTFSVLKSPAKADGEWIVKVVQEGAEGPFAAGWKLHYVAQDGDMVLKRVAIGADTPLEAELATIVLGSQFPYEVTYSAPPKDRTVTATELIERSSLPPTTKVPGADANGGPKGAPTAPPIDEAVAPSSTPAAPKQ